MTSLEFLPAQRTIPEVFEARVNSSPRHDFLLEHRGGGVHSLSYADAAHHIQLVAAALASQGVMPGDRVALIGRNCLEWAISFFAILRAGAVCVPIHAELQPGEVEALLRMSDPRFVLTSPELGQALSDLKTPIRSWTHGAPTFR
jgi:acyl-CoA synthetase (AMP-forming)/AMP-acid ligase II